MVSTGCPSYYLFVSRMPFAPIPLLSIGNVAMPCGEYLYWGFAAHCDARIPNTGILRKALRHYRWIAAGSEQKACEIRTSSRMGNQCSPWRREITPGVGNAQA